MLQVKHAFCTYFDHNYLPRAVLMIESLRRVDPETPVFALALTELCRDALTALDLPGVTVLSLAALEAEYPELPRLKGERSAVEYIFTLTPFLPLYLFGRTDAALLTYIDADLYFYADPRRILELIGPASIAITPHRFAPQLMANIMYGRFNVGWVTFRRDAEGLACLDRYRADCVEWCHDRVEDGRYADQGYLNDWPDRYQSLAIIEHKGVNLAIWNVDNYALEEQPDGTFTVDGEQLIFYHFHGIRLQEDGEFNIWLPPGHGVLDGVLMRCLYRPYMAQLVQGRLALHHRFPAIAAAEGRLRYVEGDARPAETGEWRNRGAAWPENGKDRRHDDAVSRELVAEFATYLDGGPRQREHPPLAAALAEAAGARRRISVLDWGGGVGVARVAAAWAAPTLELDWHVLDSASRCAHGAAVHREVAFHTDPAALNGRRFDLVHAAGTFGTEADWQETLRQLRRFCGRAVLLDRVAVVRDRPSLVVEFRRDKWPSNMALRHWILNEAELLAALAASGFTLQQSWALGPLDVPFAGTPSLVSVLCSVPAPALIRPLFRTG